VHLFGWIRGFIDNERPPRKTIREEGLAAKLLFKG
jgi:hypothetical protein